MPLPRRCGRKTTSTLEILCIDRHKRYAVPRFEIGGQRLFYILLGLEWCYKRKIDLIFIKRRFASTSAVLSTMLGDGDGGGLYRLVADYAIL